MKTNKIVLGLLTGGFLLSACNVNELPSFNDDDAFVSFTTTSMSIDENVNDSLVLEVLCTSLNGVSCKATISVVDSGANDAKNGVNFTYYTTSANDTRTYFIYYSSPLSCFVNPSFPAISLVTYALTSIPSAT